MTQMEIRSDSEFIMGVPWYIVDIGCNGLFLKIGFFSSFFHLWPLDGGSE